MRHNRVISGCVLYYLQKIFSLQGLTLKACLSVKNSVLSVKRQVKHILHLWYVCDFNCHHNSSMGLEFYFAILVKISVILPCFSGLLSYFSIAWCRMPSLVFMMESFTSVFFKLCAQWLTWICNIFLLTTIFSACTNRCNGRSDR